MKMEREGRTMEVDATASGQHAATRDTNQDHSLSIATDIHQPSEVWFSSLSSSTPSRCQKFVSYTFLPTVSVSVVPVDFLQVYGEFLGADGTMMEGQGIVMVHLNE